MTDHPRDVRDEQVASWLAVEPLDDVARRRLVDTAVRATARRHPRRWLAAAAALVAIAVGSALLATNGGGGGSQAARSRSAATATPKAGGADTGTAGGPAPLSAGAASAVLDVGDFGNLGDRSQLAALQHAADAAASGAAATSSPADDASRSASGPASRVIELERRLAAVSCASELPGGTVVGLGTGRFGGKDALVVAVARNRAPSSAVVVVAITSDPCRVHSLG